MDGKQLTKYFEGFVTLCTEARIDPDDKANLVTFIDGLNNDSTRGGLKTQVMSLRQKCMSAEGTTCTEIYRLCDELISTDSGSSDYETLDKKQKKFPNNFNKITAFLSRSL